MNEPPWWPKRVGVGGGCTPSHAKRGRLKHKLILVFPKKAFKQQFMNFNQLSVNFLGGSTSRWALCR